MEENQGEREQTVEPGREGAFLRTIFVLKKKHSILLFFGILTLLYLLFNSINPVIPLLSGLTRITSGDYLDSLVSLLQILMQPRTLISVLIAILAVAVVLALASGLLLSGYFHMIALALRDTESTGVNFFSGIRKYFGKVSVFSFFFFLAAEVLLVIAAIAMVPASIIYKTASGGKGELMLAAVFMGVLTVAVLLLGSLFFRVYMFFRVPVLFREDHKPWREEKKNVHTHFWGIAGRLLLFDAAFALFQFAASFVRIPVITFILQWVFVTLFFTVQSTYIFTLSQKYNVPLGTDLRGT